LARRKVIQAVSAILMNSHLSGFVQGRVYQGGLKRLCVPGMNCYSCPGALGACPIGSVQALSGNPRTLVSLYVYGFLVAAGVLFGRAVCGFLCPFGLLQELLNKAPVRNLQGKMLFRRLGKMKYLVLGVLVIGVPTLLTLSNRISFPVFCELVCPVGTLEAGMPLSLANPRIRAGLGWLFVWKVALLLLLLALSTVVFRPFCRLLCPLGAVYSLFNRVSILHIRTDPGRCTGCGSCRAACEMEAEGTDDYECIRCGRCVPVCSRGALRWSVHRDPSNERRPSRQNA